MNNTGHKFDTWQTVQIIKARKELSGDRITVGLATCGISAGARPVFYELKKAKLNILVEETGCAGMCYAEPIVTVMQKDVFSIYGYVTKDKVEMLIDSIKKEEVCKELLLGHSLEEIDYYKKQKRVVMKNCGKINPFKLEQYISVGGYAGLKNAIEKNPVDVIENIKKAGVRGRGGAGFPTWMKWDIISKKQGKKYLVCNGDEGDPGAFMNRTIMESDPFRLIEGMTIGAYAIGSDEGIIYTRAEYPLAISTLSKVIDIAKKNNLLGKNIMGKVGFDFDIRIVKGAGAFVCGEETALMRSIEGERGNPMPRPPYPAQKGIFGFPTNINNVGTFSHVTSVMQEGPETYAKIGTAKTKGTKVICLTGNIEKTGVIEVPMGIKLREIIFDIGGGCPKGTTFKAAQSGGPSGGCIPEDKLDTPFDYESIQELGAIIGSGGLVVMNNKACMVDVAKYFMNFAQEESCGKCTPCREGTKRLLEMIEKISDGLADEKIIDQIEKLALFVKDNSLCGLGQTAPNSVLTTIRYFRDEYMAHIEKKKCPSGACQHLTRYLILNNCVGCGNCARNCPVNAITGKLKEKHLIDQEKCVKCGKCYESCAFDAIERK
ncbi:MAG: 4Fe-4S binding protein [Nanoarchaeota archaeon]|nr:4Fe-4S binding protein [Nanoarchaeota archaeon]